MSSTRSTLLKLVLFSALFGVLALLATTHTNAQTEVSQEGLSPYYVQIAAGSRANMDSYISSLGGKVDYDLHGFMDGFMAVSVPASAVSALKADSKILNVEAVPSYELKADTIPYGIDLVQARDVWDKDTNGTLDGVAGGGITVCIMDTGLKGDHKDFDFTRITGTSQISGEMWNEDGNGHGTHVAGTVGALLDGSGVVGVAPEVSLHIIKVFNNAGLWVPGESNLAAATADCVANGADIISMSLGEAPFNPNDPEIIAENIAFTNAYNNDGVLSVAAASNDGVSTGTPDVFSAPASYDSVVSVAAVDSTGTHATFSNENDRVEIAGPGVNVLSSVPGPDDGGIPECSVTDNDSAAHPCGNLENAAAGTATGELVYGGLCGVGDVDGSMSGKIVLCMRGDITFREKVDNANGVGGIGTIIFNNEPGNFNGTLDPGSSLTPGVSLSQADGQYLLDNKIGTTVTLLDDDGSLNPIAGIGGYGYNSGTSMATPHVAGAAAVIWSACPTMTNDQLRSHMAWFADNPNGDIRDISYGWGNVMIADAIAGLTDGTNDYDMMNPNADGSNPANVECSDPSAVTLNGIQTASSTTTVWVLVSVLVLSIAMGAIIVRQKHEA